MEEALNVSGTPAETFTSGNGKKYTKYIQTAILIVT